MRSHEKLVAWQEAFNLCLWIYDLTRTFPDDEKFSLVKQMRRSAMSIPMNIAEGNARRSPKDRARFLEIALASMEELHCQCRISLGLKYIQEQQFQEADSRIHRVSFLINKLRSSVLK